MLKCDLQSMGGILSVSANSPIRVPEAHSVLKRKSEPIKLAVRYEFIFTNADL